MASLTEALAVNNKAPTEGADIAGNIGEGVKAGIQLATAKEQVEATKMKVTEQKMELQTKQSTALLNRITAAAYSSDPKIRNSIIDSTQGWADQSQVLFSGEQLKTLLGNDEYRNKAKAAAHAIKSGGVLSPEQMEVITSFAGSANVGDMAAVLDQSANAKVKNQQQFEIDKQFQENVSQEFIAKGNNKATVDAAAISAEAKKSAANLRNNDDVRIANGKLNSELTPMIDSLENLNKTDALLSGGGMANVAAQRTMAMAFNKGALSESDAKLFQGNQALAEKFQQYVNLGYEGKLTEDNIKEFREIVRSVKASSSNRMMATIEDRAQSFAKTYGMDANVVKDIFTPHQLIKFTTPTKGSKSKADQFREQAKALKKPGGGAYSTKEIEAIAANIKD